MHRYIAELLAIDSSMFERGQWMSRAKKPVSVKIRSAIISYTRDSPNKITRITQKEQQLRKTTLRGPLNAEMCPRLDAQLLAHASAPSGLCSSSMLVSDHLHPDKAATGTTVDAANCLAGLLPPKAWCLSVRHGPLRVGYRTPNFIAKLVNTVTTGAVIPHQCCSSAQKLRY